jgi:hypothetical protein
MGKRNCFYQQEELFSEPIFAIFAHNKKIQHELHKKDGLNKKITKEIFSQEHLFEQCEQLKKKHSKKQKQVFPKFIQEELFGESFIEKKTNKETNLDKKIHFSLFEEKNNQNDVLQNEQLLKNNYEQKDLFGEEIFIDKKQNKRTILTQNTQCSLFEEKINQDDLLKNKSFTKNIYEQQELFDVEKTVAHFNYMKQEKTLLEQEGLFSDNEECVFKTREVKIAVEEVFDEKVEKYSKIINLEYEVMKYQNNNDTSAFERLYVHFKPHFERIAFQRRDEDLIQELSEVLWNASLKYDFGANVKFKTFFWTCVHNHLGTKKIRQNAKKRSGAQVVSLNSRVINKDTDTEVGFFIEDSLTKEDYNKVDFNLCLEEIMSLDVLNYKEKTAIKMRLQGYDLKDIGDYLGGMTPPAIHSILRRLKYKEEIREKLLNLFF